jgi:hypothetical protein
MSPTPPRRPTPRQRYNPVTPPTQHRSLARDVSRGPRRGRGPGRVVSDEPVIPEVSLDNYAESAATVMEAQPQGLNALRHLLGETTEIHQRLQEHPGPDLPEDIKRSWAHLRAQLVNAASRDESVRSFLGQSRLADLLGQAAPSRDEADLACRYVEALLSHHKP